MSSPPNRSTVCCTTRAGSGARLRSATNGTTSAPVSCLSSRAAASIASARREQIATAAPPAASARAAALPRPWLAAQTSAIVISFSRGRSSMKVIVCMIQPVLPDRAEQIELERVLQRFGLMLDPRRNVQHFALAHRDFLAADQELERALQDVRHLLALVRVHRHQAAALQIDLREHLALAGHELARHHFRDFFEGDFIPAVQGDGSAHEAPKPPRAAR